mmetsp:Transcript_183752/g.447404  ORF Transcript_183752/g.447404 Transcript_183752/m.447404 type:complete len:83 (+) Transcript_183752:145-393(+)
MCVSCLTESFHRPLHPAPLHHLVVRLSEEVQWHASVRPQRRAREAVADDPDEASKAYWITQCNIQGNSAALGAATYEQPSGE